ncbi:MAG TPA: hypothetical protein VGP72_18850 [Planctomycetota bacterium]|jgi:hypothetical protein
MPAPKDALSENIAQIGALLTASGHGEWKTRIDDAIAGGATGTEILMALRWTLRQMLKQRGLRPEVKPLAKEAIAEISKRLL